MITGLLILSLAGTAQASPFADAPEGYGVGIVSGAVTGLAPVYRPNSKTTIGGALGWNTGDTALNVQADYQYTIHEVTVEEGAGIALRLTTGGGVFGDIYDSYTRAGVYVPFGATLIPGQRPFDVFLNFAPGMVVLPGTDFTARGTFGARVYFR